jgi:uncharacterized protein YoxC
VLPSTQRLIKGDDDWSVAYCVVAEPGAPEQRGMILKNGELVLDPDPEYDVWDSEDEIREAAHRFMKNGGLVTEMHKSLDPYGEVVENVVALSDFEVNGQLIKQGSWYIALAPSAQGKAAISSGEFTGVSLEGTGERVKVTKMQEDDGEEITYETTQGDKITVKGGKTFLQKAITFFTGAPIGGESGTVESTEHSQEETDVADDKRVEALEGKVETLTKAVEPLTQLSERLGKVLDAAEEKKAPTIEDLNKSLGEVSASVEELRKGVDALAQGNATATGGSGGSTPELSEEEQYARSLLGVE